MCCLVVSGMYFANGPLRNTSDTALKEKPDSRATSRKVTGEPVLFDLKLEISPQKSSHSTIAGSWAILPDAPLCRKGNASYLDPVSSKYLPCRLHVPR